MNKRVLIFIGLLIIISLSLYFFFPASKKVEFHKIDIQKPIAEPEESYNVIEGNIKKNSSLYQSLIEKNIPSKWIELIVSKLKPYLNFKNIKGGAYSLILDIKGELQKFVFEKSPTEVLEIKRAGEEYIVNKKEIPLDKRLVKVEGEIKSSLYDAINAEGEEDILALSFAEILAWEIDFYQDLRKGDRFKLVVEKLYNGDKFIQYGSIQALEFNGNERIIRGFLFEENYYNEDGISLRRPFLRAPLRFDRISSSFSKARRHPILGGIRPHYGVDYAAPKGTPVRAVADGVVVLAGWWGGYGKTVVIRHPNGYKTYYGHLSGYGPNIRRGAKVKQKQIIGYVGSTGLATGPHLDYRISKDDKFINPLKVFFPPGVPLKKERLKDFYKKRDEMLLWLNSNVAILQ